MKTSRLPGLDLKDIIHILYLQEAHVKHIEPVVRTDLLELFLNTATQLRQENPKRDLRLGYCVPWNFAGEYPLDHRTRVQTPVPGLCFRSPVLLSHELGTRDILFALCDILLRLWLQLGGWNSPGQRNVGP